MFKLNSKRSLSEIVTGLFATPIKYEVRVKDGNWSPWFGHYQNQKWGAWDSNSCWCLSGINCAEDQLEFLWKGGYFSKEAKDFFQKNGYIDSDGDFSCSERYLEILGGRKDMGGNTMEAWTLMQEHGLIPRDMLTYSHERAAMFSTKEAFNADYFNPKAVTEEMKALGQQFLKYVNIAKQRIGDMWETPQLQIMQAALRQAPIVISVPVPRETWKWNGEFIQYDFKLTADHAIELYGIDSKEQYLIFDQYLPNEKILSSDYYIAGAVQGILTAVPAPAVNPNPIVQNKVNNSVWQSLFNWFNKVKEVFQTKGLPRTAY